MQPDRWQRICEFFEAARGLRGAARDAVVAAAGDVADEVRDLLAHHDAEGFDTPDPAADAAIGAAVGPYRVEALLGRGGMASVYRAAGPDGAVALKRLHPDLCREAVILERLRREAALGMRVRHPAVVRTLGLEGCDTLVLELIDGRTLEDALARDGPLPEARCRAIAREVLGGLAAIHAAGAVHRDLKPSNVMESAGGRVVLMDLGIALPFDDLLRLSRTGQFVGTVRYCAPEQLGPQPAAPDPRTDLYALGLLLHELASGRPTFGDGGLLTTMRAQLEAPPAPLRQVAPGVSAELEALVLALLAKDPAERPASADAVARRLAAR